MATAGVILDKTQYVRVNVGYTSMLLQAHRDSVRIVMSDTKPAVSNPSYHTLGGEDPILPLNIVETNVWALAETDTSSLVVTEDKQAQLVRQELQPIIFNEYAHRHTGISSTLAVATTGAGNESTITVVNGAVFTVGNSVQISNGEFEHTFAEIKAIVGNVLTLDRQIDNAHAIGTTVEVVVFDISSLPGTLANPVEYIIKPEGTNVVHIERMLISMVHGTAGDMGLFGNLLPLANGVLVRVRNDGQYRTLTNWKDNDEIKDDMYDVTFDARSGGGGAYGTSARWSFEHFGCEVRLDGATNDQLEVYIQDDLTALQHFSIKTQGHYEVTI